jgi:hypothetical protein
MSRSLPVRPSLVQLKHQAKDLRLAAREGAADAIATLRQLRRLAGASAESIARERISLSEAQYALALDYGFASWPELKAHVEEARSRRGHSTRRADGGVVIEGFEQARWGGGSRRQCSTLATLALVSERSGDDTDYDYLMGASGAAFRVQMSEGLLCPSSPHASCGFNCAELAARAWGNEVTFMATQEEADRPAARAVIEGSISRGVPVLYEKEESSLIVGHTPAELLLRRYSADDPGYDTMQEWPWRIGIASAKHGRPELGAVLADSLRLAVQLFETAQVGRYRCGREAYAHWRELLLDDGGFERKTDREWFGAALGNAHTLECLADARGAAANYLSSMLEHTPAAARPAIERAAHEYGEIERAVRDKRRELAPFPWALGNVQDWNGDWRRRQVDFLAQIAERDEAAISELRSALEQLGGAP